MKAKYTVIFILLLLLVVIVAQNYAAVNIRLLFWSIKTSVSIIVFASIFIGIVAGLILSLKKR